MSALSAYDLWLADYRGYMGLKGASIWQHTSDGRVDGISGRVDLNIAYKDYPALIGRQGGQKEDKDDMMQFLEVFGEKNCQCFTGPDVDAVDKSHNNGTLASGTYYPVTADCGLGADGCRWVRVLAGGAERRSVPPGGGVSRQDQGGRRRAGGAGRWTVSTVGSKSVWRT